MTQGPLMPVWAARLAGFAALACLAALEWQRLVAGLGVGRVLAWVLVAVVAALALLACDRLPARWRGAGTVLVAAVAVVVAWLASGADADLLRPRRWDEAASGLVDGALALGTVRLPYAAADPWPRIVLEVLGAQLLLLAALLTFWPRERERGFPFLALAVLLVLVASPVVSLGGARPVALGAVLAALCVCFLWLERLPLRPGLGVAALLGLALAGALPLAAAADRGEPWFDYQAFAEGIGPDDPVRFAWDQRYGAIDWPRDGNEVMRVRSDRPFYWKAASLEDFDGTAWRQRTPGRVRETGSDVPDDWRNRPGWTSDIDVSIRRMRSQAVIGAGTIMAVRSSSRPLVRSGLPGTWAASEPLRRGDSYRLQVHVPQPPAVAVRESSTGLLGRQRDDLEIPMPLRLGQAVPYKALGAPGPGYAQRLVLHTYAYGDSRAPYAEFPDVDRSIFDVSRVIRRTPYARTWQLAQRLKRGTRTPLEYILAVQRYLQDGFTYSERPEAPAPGRAPLDAFLLDTKDGYCQHFSGAMALLLRMGGVPARVATGFSPGGYSARRKAWIVRDTDAHAWVEAWFDHTGWVTYDPTPTSTPARSQIAALDERLLPAPRSTPDDDRASGGGGSARGSDARQGGVRFDLLRPDPAQSDSVAAAADEGDGVPWWAWTLGGLAAAGLLVAALAWWRRRRSDRLPPVERAIAELDGALRRAGRPAPPGTTLRQLEARLGGSPEAVGYLRALSAARYGAGAAPPTAGQRRALRRALAGGLGVSGRLRAWWALPPRAP